MDLKTLSNRLLENRDLLKGILPVALEASKRLRHPLYDAKYYTPDDHPDRNQLGFHKSKARTRLILGGNQVGKSMATAWEIARWLDGTHPWLDTPKAPTVWCVSANYVNLQNGIWRHLQAFLPPWKVKNFGARVQGYDLPRRFTMNDGGRCEFFSCQGGDQARQRAQADKCHLIAIDEEIDDDVHVELIMRTLSSGGLIVGSLTAVLSYQWVLNYETRAEEGDPKVFLARFDIERAVEAGHADADALEEAKNLLDPTDQAVRLHGGTRRHEGLVYPEFGKHNIIWDDGKWELPVDAQIHCALDPGWRRFAVLWAAIFPDHSYIFFRELYLAGMTAREVADAIFKAEGWLPDLESPFRWRRGPKTEDISVRLMDKHEFGHTQAGGLRTGSLYSGEDYNLPCIPSRVEVETGIEYLRLDMVKDPIKGRPRLRVLSSCEWFLREQKAYRRRRDVSSRNLHERKDEPIRRNNHLVDCARYLRLHGLAYSEEPRKKLWHEDDALGEAGFSIRASGSIERLVREDLHKILKRQRNRDLASAGNYQGPGNWY